MSQNEGMIWKGSPSLILNIKNYVISFIAIVFIAYLLYMTKLGLLIEKGMVFDFINNRDLVLVSVFALVFIYMFFDYIGLKNIAYNITNERIEYREGILDAQINMIELYRIKDYLVIKPFYLRLFNLGNIKIISSDRTNPEFTILAISEPEDVLIKLRNAVERQRQLKGVREFD